MRGWVLFWQDSWAETGVVSSSPLQRKNLIVTLTVSHNTNIDFGIMGGWCPEKFCEDGCDFHFFSRFLP